MAAGPGASTTEKVQSGIVTCGLFARLLERRRRGETLTQWGWFGELANAPHLAEAAHA